MSKQFSGIQVIQLQCWKFRVWHCGPSRTLNCRNFLETKKNKKQISLEPNSTLAANLKKPKKPKNWERKIHYLYNKITRVKKSDELNYDNYKAENLGFDIAGLVER